MSFLNAQRIWTWVYVKFQAASWQFAPETARMQPRQPTPNTQLATHLKTQNCKESAAWMLIPVHFWQRTSNDGNHLATHLKIRIQCPEPTPNYDLAAGNAPETAKRTSNHIAGCPANMQLEWGSGKETLGEGTPPPPKRNEGWKTKRNQKNCEPTLIVDEKL